MVKKQIKCGVDCDGVISNFCKSFSERLRNHYGDHLPLITKRSQVLNYNWHFYPLPAEVIDKELSETKNYPEIWDELEILDSSDFYILKSKLFHCGRKIDAYFITSRPEPEHDVMTTHKRTTNWLSKHGISNPQVVVGWNKGEIVKALRIQYFIDDKIDNCLDVARVNPECKVYVLDYPTMFLKILLEI